MITGNNSLVHRRILKTPLSSSQTYRKYRFRITLWKQRFRGEFQIRVGCLWGYTQPR